MKTAAVYVRGSTVDRHVESHLYVLRELAGSGNLEVVQESARRRETASRRCPQVVSDAMNQLEATIRSCSSGAEIGVN
jgi:hypothetical protein